MKNFFSKLFFSRPDSLGRIFWPSKEEVKYLKINWKKFFKSKVFYLGIFLFFTFLISDFLIKNFIQKDFHFQIFSWFCITKVYHPVSKIASLFAILFLIRILIFLRFKTFWRSNKFFDLGFGILLGAILSRLRDFGGSTDWLEIGSHIFNLIDILYFFGLLFLMIGVIICPKRKYGYGKEDSSSNN